MTRTVERLWMHDFLALIGVPRPALREVLQRNEGDKAGALREVLAGVVDDPHRPLHTRKMAALKLVLLEPDPQRRWAWQHAAYEFELADLAAHDTHEADIASANYKCPGCRKLSGTLVDVDHPDWLANMPPMACQRLEKRKPCCIFFSPRIWSAPVRPPARPPASAKPHNSVDAGDSLGPVAHDHDAKAA
jgi:hypothetical protein